MQYLGAEAHPGGGEHGLRVFDALTSVIKLAGGGLASFVDLENTLEDRNHDGGVDEKHVGDRGVDDGRDEAEDCAKGENRHGGAALAGRLGRLEAEPTALGVQEGVGWIVERSE